MAQVCIAALYVVRVAFILKILLMFSSDYVFLFYWQVDFILHNRSYYVYLIGFSLF